MTNHSPEPPPPNGEQMKMINHLISMHEIPKCSCFVIYFCLYRLYENQKYWICVHNPKKLIK